MSAVTIRPPTFDQPFVDENGYLTTWARMLLSGFYNREGGQIDKVDAAYTLAEGATQNTTEVVAVAPLTGGGPLSSNIPINFGLGSMRVGDLPAPILDGWAYCIDGRKSGEGAGSGTGIWAWSDGSGWLAMDTSAPVAA